MKNDRSRKHHLTPAGNEKRDHGATGIGPMAEGELEEIASGDGGRRCSNSLKQLGIAL